MSISLKAGENYVTYTGKVQPSLDALASLVPYGLVTPVWYWNNVTSVWEIMQTPGFPIYDRVNMVPNGYYRINISQDCIWTYDAGGGFDISTLLTSIMPLIGLVMVMQLIKPMMRGLVGSKD